MTLKDPSKYVSIPPALIFGADELQRESYKGLLQLVGWMWVTKWWTDNGSSKPLCTSLPELAERWGVAERTVQWRLQQYSDHGFLVVNYGRDGRVTITMGHRALDDNYRPREAANNMQSKSAQPQAARGGETTGRVRRQDNTPGEPADNTPGEPANYMQSESVQTACSDDGQLDDITAPAAQTACAKQGQDAAFDDSRANSLRERNSIINSSGSSLHTIPRQGEPLPQTTNTAVLERLHELRLHPDKALALAGDPWVTVDRVNRWWQDLQRQGDKAHGGPIISYQAVLYTNLNVHWEPPEVQDDEPEWNRYVSGEYADFIEH